MDDLKAKLAAQEIELKQKNEDADKLIKVNLNKIYFALQRDISTALHQVKYLECISHIKLSVYWDTMIELNVFYSSYIEIIVGIQII